MPGLDPLEAALKAYNTKAEPPSSVSFIDPVLYLEPVGVNPEGKAKVVVVDWVDSVVDPAVSV